jgi:leucyl aminopeptidase
MDMELQVESRPIKDVAADWLIVGVAEGTEFTGPAAATDQATGGLLGRLREMGDLTGKPAELLPVREVAGMAARRILLVGLGRPGEISAAGLEKALLTAVRHASEKKDVNVAIAVPDLPGGGLGDTDAARLMGTCLEIGCAGQGLYKGEPARFPFRSATIVASAGRERDLRTAAERGRIVGEAVNLTRELVTRPAEEIYPESMAERAQQIARAHGLTCEVLDEKRLRDERMGSLLAVAQGSDRPPRVVALEYRGPGAQGPGPRS